ncbi:MAG: FtsX-like permease family protein [Chloroflexota bacterium]
MATSLRRLRDERLSAFGLAGLVFATALTAAAAPRLEARVADDTLLATIARAQPANRNVQWLREDRFETGGADTVAAIGEISNQVHALLPDRVANLVTERSWSIDSGRWQLPEVVGDPVTMRLRFQPDAMARVTLQSGRWPTGATTEGPDRTSTEALQPSVRFFEAAVSTPTTEAIGVAVGDTLMLVSDGSDPLVGPRPPMVVGVTIVGTYTVDDQADPWWLGGLELARPSIRSLGGDTRITDTLALLSPDAYRAFLDETLPAFLPLRYTFREYLDPTRLSAADAPAMLVDLRRLDAAYPSPNVTFNQPIALRTGLRTILEAFNGQWASATALLTVGVMGPGVVAVAALALVALLAAQRRRSALALARGRGASLTQVVAAVVAEGVLLAVPAAAGGLALAVLAFPADALVPSVVAAALVALVAVAVLVAATVPATGGSSFGSARESSVPRPPTPRRLILEGLVVILAAGGAVLLRDRGIRGASSAGNLAQADPLIAAVPALAGIAAGLIAVRLLPLPIRLLARLARRRRDLVPLLALRRSTQAASSAPILVVLLATATIASFGAAVLGHLERASEAAAWHTVGAAYRIDNTVGALRSGFDPEAIPAVEASAVAYRAAITVGPRNLRADFVAVAADDYDRVVAGTPADPHLPVDLFAADPSVIPLVASAGVAGRPDGMNVGDRFPITLEGYTFPAEVVAVRSDLPAFSRANLFVVASRDQIKALFPGIPLLPSIAFLRAPDAAAGAIRAAVLGQIPVGATVTGRADVTQGLRDGPASRAVVGGITAATILAMVYAALAVAAAMALAGGSRAVEVAHLRTLGLTGGQATSLVVVEHGPTVLTAFLAGLGLGIGLLALLRDGLGIEALAGSAPDVPVGLEPGQLLLVLGGIVAVVVLGLGLGSWMQRGAAPITALRRGFE